MKTKLAGDKPKNSILRWQPTPVGGALKSRKEENDHGHRME